MEVVKTSKKTLKVILIVIFAICLILGIVLLVGFGLFLPFTFISEALNTGAFKGTTVMFAFMSSIGAFLIIVAMLTLKVIKKL